MAENAASLDTISQKDLWKLLLKTSEKTPERINVSQNLIDNYFSGNGGMDGMQKKELSKEQRKEIQDLSREALKNLNLRWLDIMINSEAQLREKMSLFWHGHFACRVNNSYFQQELLQLIRENALGNFKDLLMAVSKSPAMLQFLNNQQNRKQHPNENFAREVMELLPWAGATILKTISKKPQGLLPAGALIRREDLCSVKINMMMEVKPCWARQAILKEMISSTC